MATYDKGDQVRVTATFKTAGTATATTSTCTHRQPDGSNIDPAPTVTSEIVELEVAKSVFAD